ncbi:FtsX-like permease family protein [Streptomyces pinistramenti]|uniref:FtsX-like permease family protein n=1 Tax=Streptomyces pinistramenti TaxID=2884812 RepID=UPI001D08CF80|nr:FtsX-like permease family protein [Streptomyces pinistramenti]MCB5911903.1 ABC transporter permease [Streptomyces pinistramenti]
MTLLDERRGGTHPAASGTPAPPAGLAAWARDLGMGLRFAAGGGREGWIRTLLTAVGVALGVVLLLGAASVPQLLQGRDVRGQARQIAADMPVKQSSSSLVAAEADSEFRGTRITGTLVRPDGPDAPAPPGVTALPRPGEMVVSPALKDLLASPDGALLRERLPYRITGTIADTGLVGPNELTYYAGSATLTTETEQGGHRIGSFGIDVGEATPSAILVVLIILACVVLLMPVALFIATAVRFGGELRDRRLAALRLIGADVHMTRRTAAGEALFGSLCGLLLGGLLFLVGRQFTGLVTLWDINAFPSDMTPSPALTVLIALAVPAAAVAVTLVALRGVTIEPLGVVRHATARRRRLWWRIPVPLIGLAMLLLSNRVDEGDAQVNPTVVAGGAVLVLSGITLLLPWTVEAVVARFKGGPVPWQLATRRLQLSSGTAARAVGGITVAVAGAIALQLFFSAVQSDFTSHTGQDSRRAQMSATLPSHDMSTIRKMLKEFRDTRGVRSTIGVIEASVTRPGPLRKGEEFAPSTTLTVGDCASLQELLHTGPCKDGDTFIVTDHTGTADDDYILETARPGASVLFHADPQSGKPVGKPRLWTIPKETRKVRARMDPSGSLAFGIFATPGAVDTSRFHEPTARAMLKVDPSVPDAAEHIRNTAARLDPLMQIITLHHTTRDQQFTSIRTGLLVGSTVTMALIAASMLVSTLEQLRERRRLLSVLVAFGTRRATLAWSVLWQTAVPVLLGLVLAVAGGVALGGGLLRMAGKSTFDWSAIWPLPLAGAGLVLLVTLLSLPPLWRMMRPDGLRSE